MSDWLELLLVIAGWFAGLIDSAVGGSGLITLPTLSITLGPGAIAVGTNKVAATCSCFFALLVYMRRGHVRLRGNRRFALLVGVGAILGSLTSPYIPPSAYRWILIAICPVILWIVFRKDLWLEREVSEHAPQERPSMLVLGSLGFAAGFYDGIAGPGGGTLMFLSLFLIARLPLLAAMATAKVANLTSASLALVSFAATGHVVWSQGLWLGLGISAGATVGASFASKHAANVARIALLLLSSLLLVRLAFG